MASSSRNCESPSRSERRRGWPYILFLLLFWGVLFGGIAVWRLTSGLPDVETLMAPATSHAVTILDVKGRQILVYGLKQAAPTDVTRLPAYVPNAFIAIEDRRFRHHFGIDPVGMVRAGYQNVRHGGVVQGGSTLTQQLAKNLFLEPDRTLRRKLQEAVLALYLEHRYRKDQILSLYLTRVSFGAGVVGLEAAAQRFFGKPAAKLTPLEAAMLAGSVKAPSRLNPITDSDACHARAAIVLRAMRREGYIDEATLQAELATLARIFRGSATPGAGYFGDWILAQIAGFADAARSSLVVETTIDLDTQTKAERAIVAGLENVGEDAHVAQAALVALAPDGAVRAMVGGRSYAQSPFNRASEAMRQPGSAFKPFVYLAAFEKGHTPDETYDDAPVDLHGWKPRNYEGGYLGEITLERAFAVSSNSVAAQLADAVGAAAVVQTARKLGVVSPMEEVSSLALGTVEVSPLELTSAYVPFANGGRSAPPYAILTIRTPGGKILYRHRFPERTVVIGPENLAQMLRLMRAVVETGTGRAARLTGRQCAGKTGTSQDFRDAWFVGFSADLIAGIWVGNDDAAPMNHISGGSLPAKIFRGFMDEAESGLVAKPLPGQSSANAPQPSPKTPSDDLGGLIGKLMNGL